MDCPVEIATDRYYREMHRYDMALEEAEEFVDYAYEDIMHLGYTYAQLWCICGGNDNGAADYIFETLGEAWERSSLQPHSEVDHDFQNYIPFDEWQTPGCRYDAVRQRLIEDNVEDFL